MKSTDHEACDTADWTISLKLNWFYLRILYWLLDSLLREMYSMVKAVGLGLDYYYPWEKYSNDINWWYRFQMDSVVVRNYFSVSMDYRKV